ncbi:MAG: zinc ribbon domain-containing protein, partial [Anaerolineaceae bacterium]
MIQGGTPVPKREIVNIILQVMPIELIRSLLNIQAETDLRRRLDDFPKHQLVEALQSTVEGQTALNDAKARYPLSTKPTLYLVSISHWPDHDELLGITHYLAQIGSEGKVHFGADRTLRSIYMITPLREIQAPINHFEIPLVYEKKIEYIESDPTSEEYGEPREIYSLEKALIWYCSQYKHALLLCGDYSAVKPILYYGTTKLGISWQLPYLSEGMLQRLAEGATPRSASFSRLDNAIEDEFDAQTMTVFDSELGQSRSFNRLINDESKQQTSGFYTNHPDLVDGGLGISRQYGRIWTPTKLRKDSLLGLSMNLIQKTETELARESDINLDGFIGYYRNIPIKIRKRKIDSTQRTIFTNLIRGIITAKKTDHHEYVLEPGLINDLIAQREILDLLVGIEVSCENCGSYLLRCPDCQAPLHPTTGNDGQIVFQCERHPEELTIFDNQQIRCDCGSEIDVTLSTDIRIYPGAELLKSLHQFLSRMENQQYDGSFLIQGNVLHLVTKNRNGMNQYNLDNFQYWQARAHLHQRHPGENVAENYRSILS